MPGEKSKPDCGKVSLVASLDNSPPLVRVNFALDVEFGSVSTVGRKARSGGHARHTGQPAEPQRGCIDELTPLGLRGVRKARADADEVVRVEAKIPIHEGHQAPHERA